MASRSIWKGHLTFGLVSIPVKMYTAARDKSSVELHHYHSTCGDRVKQPKFCNTCARNVPEAEVVKGYEVSETKHITITKEELAAITPDSEKVMEISGFVKVTDIDLPKYLAESFYLLPEAAGTKVYSLLVQALKAQGRAAITQLTKNGRENMVLIRPSGNGLMLHYLWYPNEISELPEFSELKEEKISAAELKLANQLIQNLDTPFEPEEFENGYDQRLTQLVASKLNGKIVDAPAAVAKAPAMDLMSALSASLNKKPVKKSKKAVA